MLIIKIFKYLSLVNAHGNTLDKDKTTITLIEIQATTIKKNKKNIVKARNNYLTYYLTAHGDDNFYCVLCIIWFI